MQSSPRPPVDGDDRLIASYLESELLSFLSEDDIRFATRTAVLERMSGPLCDAVLEPERSAEILQIARALEPVRRPAGHAVASGTATTTCSGTCSARGSSGASPS